MPCIWVTFTEIIVLCDSTTKLLAMIRRSHDFDCTQKHKSKRQTERLPNIVMALQSGQTRMWRYRIDVTMRYWIVSLKNKTFLFTCNGCNRTCNRWTSSSAYTQARSRLSWIEFDSDSVVASLRIAAAFMIRFAQLHCDLFDNARCTLES